MKNDFAPSEIYSSYAPDEVELIFYMLLYNRYLLIAGIGNLAIGI